MVPCIACWTIYGWMPRGVFGGSGGGHGRLDKRPGGGSLGGGNYHAAYITLKEIKVDY